MITGTEEPGLWVVVLKTDGDVTFGYDSPLWESDDLLNADSPVELPGNAKYGAYVSEPFDAIKACIDTIENCESASTVEFDGPIASARDLFSSLYRRVDDSSQNWAAVFGASGQQDCPPQSPGFNTMCADGNAARWGYCNNVPDQGCQSDGADSDGVIGFGLKGQDCCPMGAGHTSFFVSDTNLGSSAGNEMRKQAWIMVRKLRADHPYLSAGTLLEDMVDLDTNSALASWGQALFPMVATPDDQGVGGLWSPVQGGATCPLADAQQSDGILSVHGGGHVQIKDQNSLLASLDQLTLSLAFLRSEISSDSAGTAAGDPAPLLATLNIVQATYGGNCNGQGNYNVQPGNENQHLQTECNGLESCSYFIDHRVIGNPAGGCEHTRSPPQLDFQGCF